MQDSKLIQALRLLSGRQQSRFAEFVRSPYFNKSDELVSFFGYLQKYAPEYEHKNVDKENVLRKASLFDTKDTKKLSTLMSQLLALLEKFLIIEAMEARPQEGWMTLADIYHEAQLAKHYNSTLGKAEKWLTQPEQRDAGYFHYRYQLKKLAYDHSDPTRRSYNPQLQEASDALDQLYLLEKLRYCCEMINYEKTLDIHYQPHFAEALLAELKTHKFAAIPAITIYLLLLKLLSDIDNTAEYFELKSKLEEHAGIFSPNESRHLYTALLNFCTRRVTQLHDQEFEKEYFQLNASLLDKGLLLEEGVLSPWRYSNLVTVALRLGELDWTKIFIEKYKACLPEAHAENLYQYKSGQYLYHIGELHQAQAALHKVDLNDPFLAMSVKNLLAKIYYESGETELLLSFLEAYRIAILRDKLTQPQLQQQLRHFIDATRKLARLAHHEINKLESLQSSLPDEKEMMHKDWILSMIDRKKQQK